MVVQNTSPPRPPKLAILSSQLLYVYTSYGIKVEISVQSILVVVEYLLFPCPTTYLGVLICNSIINLGLED